MSLAARFTGVTLRVTAASLLAAAALAGATGRAQAQPQIPADASGGGNLTELAAASWSARSGSTIRATSLVVARSVGASIFGIAPVPPLAGTATTLYLVQTRCGVVHGKPSGCTSTRSRAFELGPSEFEFDPLLQSARVSSSTARATISWRGVGESQNYAQPSPWEKHRADAGNLWWEGGAGTIVGASRPAKVTGKILGLRIPRGHGALTLAAGEYTRSSGCVLDRGDVCS